MKTYNIGLATDCPLDDDFFDWIEKAAQDRGLNTYRIYPHNLDETLQLLESRQIRFLAFYDRASDTSIKFLKIYSIVPDNQIYYFSDLDLQNIAADKSLMHVQFLKNNIKVPKTIILPEYVSQNSTHEDNLDLEFLGRPFVIKPSIHTGAGGGVFLNGYGISEIEDKRKEFPRDKYLIQEKIYPKEIYCKRFWFRAFYICGKIIITWWNDYGHRYDILTQEDFENFDLNQFNQIMIKIHEICALNFFSTELAISDQEEVYVIDYVNEICDMRLKSKHVDGIPDEIVKKIAEEIVLHIRKKLANR